MTPPRPRQGSLEEKVWFRLTGLHIALYRWTGGRIGGRMFGCPVLLLDHVGRKSGKKRTAPLLCMEDGANIVVVASYGGAKRDPAWWGNLRAAGETTVQLGRERRRVRAQEAEGEERARLWPRLVDAYPDYGVYQERTERRIPVVVLAPAG